MLSPAAAEVQALIEDAGISVDASAHDGYDLVLAGSGVRLAVTEATAPSASAVRDLVSGPTTADIHVLVTDRLGPGQQRILEEAGWGWLDRRGHLRIVGPYVAISHHIDDLTIRATSGPDPLGRPSGLSVATYLLEEPRGRSIRAIADELDISVGSSASAVRDLEDVGLITSERRPTVPQLFWEVAARWKPRWFGLETLPRPGLSEPVQRLVQLGHDDPEGPGWAEVGLLAAQAYGLRVVARSEPPSLYVPTKRALTWSLRTFGEAPDHAAGMARIAVAPAATATRRRHDVAAFDNVEGWLFAPPLYVALTLAAGMNPRDSELLDRWDPDPTHGQRRVW